MTTKFKAMMARAILNVVWDANHGQIDYSIRGYASSVPATSATVDHVLGYPHVHLHGEGTANGHQVVLEVDGWLTDEPDGIGEARFTLAAQSNPSVILFDSGNGPAVSFTLQE